MKNKKYYINKYQEIHGNIASLEKEIENFDKNSAIGNPDSLINLKKRVIEQIQLLEKTRKDELKNYS